MVKILSSRGLTVKLIGNFSKTQLFDMHLDIKICREQE